MLNDLAEAMKVLDGKKLEARMIEFLDGSFFPFNAFMASARSFNMFKSMLQLGLID